MSSKKGTSGSGCIVQRKDGRWEVKLSVTTGIYAGRRISLYAKTRKEAQAKLIAKQHEINMNELVLPSKATVEDYVNGWMNNYIKTKTPHTQATYRQKAQHIIKCIGKIELCKLSELHIQKMINLLMTGSNEMNPLAPKTIRDIQGLLHKALAQAVKLCYIRSNPADDCELPKVTPKEKVLVVNDEAKDFLKEAKGDEFYEVYLTALMTGLREGELLGLTWDCINFDSGLIYVKHQLQQEKKKNARYLFAPLKNNKPRTVPMPNSLSTILKALREKQIEWKKTAGEAWQEDKNLSNLVFTSQAGEHLRFSTVRKHFKKIVKKIGHPDARIHDLRHSYAVSSLQAGDDVKTLQENLGHYSAAFTLQVYGHVSKEMRNLSRQHMETYFDSLGSIEKKEGQD